MAFEALAVELIRSGAYPEGFDFSEWRELALTFGLDRESVIDADFWPRFLEWGAAYRPS